jgi:hypothetical protein
MSLGSIVAGSASIDRCLITLSRASGSPISRLFADTQSVGDLREGAIEKAIISRRLARLELRAVQGERQGTGFQKG